MRQYITTAIDYPNAPPHMGHVMEKVLADVTARWFRLRGDEVRFQIGTDEHGVKIQRKAEEENITPQVLVDRNVPLFQDLYRRLQISSDDFIRTTDRRRHWPTVQALWKKLVEAGVLEKRTYTGLYCAGCERFMTKRDLVDGKCPNHNTAPEEVSEENYFFLLSKDSAWLKKLLAAKKGGYAIVPASRAQETLSLIESGLEDVSFSRPKSSLAWGIPVPDDPDHVMYVWCDALTNYISGIDIFGLSKGPFDSASLRSGSFDSSKNGPRPQAEDHERGPQGRVEWWDDATVTHVIGKDIARFHALIWPAMLKHAGVRTPDRLLIHGFLTSEGQKMSKSIGNVVMPEEVLQKFNGNPDPLRFYLSHEVPVGNDGDFSWKRIEELYDGILRNKLGNLLNRLLVLLKKNKLDLDIGSESVFIWGGDTCWDRYTDSMNEFDLWSGIHFVFDWVDACDKYIAEREPWKMKDSFEIQMVLSVLAENLRHISLMLLPFIPQTAQEISKQLGVPYADRMREKDFQITAEMKKWGGEKSWKKVGEPRKLFEPLS
ncbi:MAG: methionine--tRNA ligase [Candidatus Peribacteraceae bacterium]|jgi:methionyl-tRNA synthetase|nr:methionine--tRNA ligase [Candidatus Peribacteraceae bacterium]